VLEVSNTYIKIKDVNREWKGDYRMGMTVGKKLFAGFFGVLIILAAIVVASYVQFKWVDHTYSDLIDDKANKLILIKELDLAIKKEQVGLRGFMILGDDTALNSFNKAYEQYQETSKKLDHILTHPKAKGMLQELNQIQQEYYQFSEAVFQLKEDESDEYANLISTQGREIVSRFDQKIEEFTEYQQGLLDNGKKETTAAVQSSMNIMLVLGIIAIAAGVIIAFYIGRMISKPVVAIAESVEKIASGDLTVEELKVRNKDEIGKLAHSFNQMTMNLREMIHQVGSSAEQVAASAQQLTASAEQTGQATEHIASAMQEVAVGVDNQVQSVEETSQTISEMSTGIQQVANNAHSVSSSAIDASEKASEGGQAVKSAVEQMNSINQTVNGLSEVIGGLGERSKEIGQIIGAITDIAAQTNLLALNAAIEAARAGEHGRGFAVVADEVRKLAEQSADSAQQISQLISSIQGETNRAVCSMEVAAKEVFSGIGIVNRAGESFKQIEGSIHEVTTQIQEISSAVQQMAAGSEQIVQSMQFITEVSESASSGTQGVSAATEEQLAAMEEISSSANALSTMAVDLQRLIGKFKI